LLRSHGSAPTGHNDGRRLATILALAVPARSASRRSGASGTSRGPPARRHRTDRFDELSRELTEAVDEHRWRIGLTAVLAGYDVFLGADALPKAAGLVGILGGLAVWLALWVAPQAHRLAVGLLAVGALAFAIVTWWSAITPISRSCCSARASALRPGARIAPPRRASIHQQEPWTALSPMKESKRRLCAYGDRGAAALATRDSAAGPHVGGRQAPRSHQSSRETSY